MMLGGTLLLGGICTGSEHPAPFTLYDVESLPAALAVQVRLRTMNAGRNSTEVTSAYCPHNFKECAMAAAAVCAF